MSNLKLDFEPNKLYSTKGTLIVFGNEEKPLFSDTLDIANSKKRKQFVEEVANICEAVSKKQLEQAILEKIAWITIEKRKADEKAGNDEEENQPLVKSKIALAETDPELVSLAEELLYSPDLMQKIVDHVHMLGVAGENESIIAIYVIGTSRLLMKPLAGLMMGQSSAGKSFVINMAARLFPKEAVLQAHRISPTALEHLPEGSLIHRFIVAGERSRLQDDAAAEATRALREMISDRRMSSLVSAPQKSGPHQTVHVEQEGPIAYIENTTLGIKDIFNEDRTRFIILSVDESKKQNIAIIKQIASSAAEPNNPDKSDSIIALHHTAQRLLKPLDVKVPFAKELQNCLPVERVEVRRTFDHLISLIQAVALLYQFQRQRNQHGQIIATPDDYEVVRKYLAQPLATSLGCELTPGARILLDTVTPMDEFTASEVETRVLYAIKTVYSRIRELVAAGQVRKTEEARGRSSAKYIVVENAPTLHGLLLPELKLEGEKSFSIDVSQTIADKA